MTQPPHLPLPPFGDDTDEALTALIDGGLAAFASERGLTEAQAREQLEQWPGFAARQAELEGARTAVRAPVAPLDDLTRRRLVRGALDAEHADSVLPVRSTRPWLRVTAAAAAALFVIAGIGAVMSSISTDTGDNESSRATSGDFELPSGDLGNLGDVSNPETLRALLDPAAAKRTEGSESAVSSTVPAAGGGSVADSSGEEDSALTAPQRQAATPPSGDSSGNHFASSPQACAARFAGSRPRAFVATGTYQGQPVTIVGLEQGGRRIAFVVSSTDCSTVLTSVSR